MNFEKRKETIEGNLKYLTVRGYRGHEKILS